MVDNFTLGMIGIAVSVSLYLLGYRRVFGAKKERISLCNSEIEKILVRRIVLEQYTPKTEDITRLIDGKARDFRVRPTELLSESQLLNNIFTRVVETDFISKEQRDEVLNRLTPIIEIAEERPDFEETEEGLYLEKDRMRIVAIGIMAIFATTIGTFIVSVPTLREAGTEIVKVIPFLLATATASLLAISFIMLLNRIREKQQEVPSKSSAIASFVEFERDVIKIFDKSGLNPHLAGPKDHGFDFILKLGKKKVLVEVKAWKSPIPTRMVMMVLDVLRGAMSREGADEAILVTRATVNLPEKISEYGHIKILTLRELRNYLAHETYG